MFEKKVDKSAKQVEATQRDDGVELENQFILRLPLEPAKVLHEAIQSGANNFRDRFQIKVDPDLRFGEVRIDHWLLHAKILDLPTIVESLKTIDGKNFYKSADICQLMIAKEEPDAPVVEEESPNKAKKKDPNKVDKKFLWPHGVTPPCKNVRKRRFRKTLKKKCVEAPEIEKEVKRLLRSDNDAASVKYEIINEDEDTFKTEKGSDSKDQSFDNEDAQTENRTLNYSKELNSQSDGETSTKAQRNHHGVAEHDIFGGEVSSSDEEEDRPNRQDVEDNTRNSGDDSRLSSFSMPDINTSKEIVTQFDQSMFNNQKENSATNIGLTASNSFYEEQEQKANDYDEESNEPQMSRDEIVLKISELRKQCDDFKVQQSQKAQEISSIQNATLKQRMQETLDNILSQIVEKEMEIQDYQNMLDGTMPV